MEYSIQFDHAELPTAGEDFVGVRVRAALAPCALRRERRVVGGAHQQVCLVVGRIVCRGWGGSGLGAYIRVGRVPGACWTREGERGRSAGLLMGRLVGLEGRRRRTVAMLSALAPTAAPVAAIEEAQPLGEPYGTEPAAWKDSESSV